MHRTPLHLAASPAASVRRPSWLGYRAATGIVAACALGLSLAAMSPSAHAQGRAPATLTAADEQAGGTSYITPFPPGDIYKLQVYGDNVSEDLQQVLIETSQPEDRVDIGRKYRSISGLTRSEADDDLRTEEQSRDIIHIGVIFLGYNDRASLRTSSGSSVKFGSPAWKDQYAQRVDRLLKALKRRNAALYVVGLPPLRRSDANGEADIINQTLLERTQANGVRFVETQQAFSDESGAFSQFGPDVAGNRDKLRDGDGVGFTKAGMRKLAALVAADLKRDLAAARAERAVPLAGAEVEQKRINPDKAAASAPGAWKGIITKDGREVKQGTAGQAPQATPAAAAVRSNPGQGDQKADPGRVSLRFPAANGRDETITVEIVRPAIPAAMIALLSRKEAADAIQQPFDLLADDIGDGISVTTMITAQTDGANNRRRGQASQNLYTQVWVKGERLAPKPGRADDFAWPRPDSLPYVPPNTPRASGAAPAKIPAAQPNYPRSRPLPGNRS